MGSRRPTIETCRPRSRALGGHSAKTRSRSAPAPGCVKTPKGRSRRGIVFYRRRGFRVVLQPLATTLVLEKKVILCVPHALAFLTRPRPIAVLGGCLHIAMQQLPSALRDDVLVVWSRHRR